MNDLEKLKHLIEHWAEHNKEHVKTYLDWAEKARALGEHDLFVVLNEIADVTRKLDGQFNKAMHIISKIEKN